MDLVFSISEFSIPLLTLFIIVQYFFLNEIRKYKQTVFKLQKDIEELKTQNEKREQNAFEIQNEIREQIEMKTLIQHHEQNELRMQKELKEQSKHITFLKEINEYLEKQTLKAIEEMKYHKQVFFNHINIIQDTLQKEITELREKCQFLEKFSAFTYNGLGQNQIDAIRDGCHDGQFDIIKYIYEDKRIHAAWSSLILMEAARSDSVQLLQYLYDRFKNSISSDSSFHSISFLHIACEAGKLENCKFLIENNIYTVNSTPLNSSELPIHAACQGGHLDVAQYLIEKGASINAKGNGDNTALHWAVRSGNVSLVQFLLSRGADKKALNRNGQTPIQDAQVYCPLKTRNEVVTALSFPM